MDQPVSVNKTTERLQATNTQVWQYISGLLQVVAPRTPPTRCTAWAWAWNA